MGEGGVKRWSVRVPDGLALAASTLAEIEGKSINQLVVELLAARLASAKTDPETVARVKAEIDAIREQYGL